MYTCELKKTNEMIPLNNATVAAFPVTKMIIMSLKTSWLKPDNYNLIENVWKTDFSVALLFQMYKCLLAYSFQKSVQIERCSLSDVWESPLVPVHCTLPQGVGTQWWMTHSHRVQRPLGHIFCEVLTPNKEEENLWDNTETDKKIKYSSVRKGSASRVTQYLFTLP